MSSELKIENYNIDDLVPYARNPRKNDDSVDAIAASIKEFGFTQPIVINKDGVIVAGHTRLKAAKKLGLKQVPVAIAEHWTEEQAKAYRLLDNKLAEKSSWDSELLSLELNELEFDLSPFDVDFADDVTEPSVEVVEDEIPEELETPVTQPGDLWLLGDHRLLCGDSTSAADVARLMAGGKAEIMFTSPPYLDLREYDGKTDLSIEKLAGIFTAWEPDYYIVNLGIVRRDHAVVRYWDEWIARAEKAGHRLLSWNVWNKDSAGNVSNQNAFFSIIHEWIFVFGQSPKQLKFIIPNNTEENQKRARYDRTDSQGRGLRLVRQSDGSTKESPRGTYREKKHLGTVQTILSEKARNIDHPAPFPTELPAQYIMSFEGDVCEPFSGSGTTIIAAEQLGRKCYAMEIAPKYVDVAVQRWQILTGKDAVLERTGETFEGIRLANPQI